LKVIELLGRENTELSAKQIKQIINVLCEEEKLKLEESIEELLMRKPSKEEEDLAQKREIEGLKMTADLNKSASTEKHTSHKSENP